MIIMAVAFTVVGFVREQQSDAVPDLSSGLYVIANQNNMAKSALVGQKIVFSEDDFKKNLNVSQISTVTVTKTPSSEEGALCVGDVLVNEGQTVSAANLSLLNFRAANGDVRESSFKFKVNSFEYEMTCNLYFLKNENSAPTLLLEDERSFSVSTHQSVTVWGRVSAYDKDGDPVRYEVVTYAKNGTLRFDGETGDYSYTPTGTYFGEDSFEYVAVDKYGNYSTSRKVTLAVKERSTDVNFEDMVGHKSHHAALTMAEIGVMSGTNMSGKTYFMPDRAVSRVDFIVMLMDALGYAPSANVTSTGFTDDADIPPQFKGYVCAARDRGLVLGTVNSKGEYLFEPSREITRSEAALIVSKVVDAPVPTIKPTFADKTDIPTWARDAVYTLNSLGILDDDGGFVSPNAPLTRASLAAMLCELLEYK